MNLFRSKNGNSTNHKFTQRALLLIPLALACFALLPTALAIVPPPDGGYPGFTTAEGQNALQNLTTGVGNTAAGWHSLFTNSVGNLNTAIGAGTLLFNTGDNNTATGALALLSNTTGLQNTANGAFALLTNTDGRWNTAIGDSALSQNTIGDRNVAVGYAALSNNTTGGGNVALGGNAGANVTTAGNVICIGNDVGGANVSSGCYIGNIYGASIDPTNSLVGVDLNGKLGVTTSARRFKRDIQPMDNASEVILALKPVRFHYKGDVKSIPCFGLVAEDVEKVNPDLIVRDKNGETLSVRYEQINAMLLNEFLKARRQIDAQQEQIDALIAGLQKVSAQLEVSKPAPQTVLND